MKYTDLSDFTRGYVDAIFFTECHCDNEDLEDKTFEDFAPETITKIVEDCAGFELLNSTPLDYAYEYQPKYTKEQAGIDFWLTRNGHGAGYWDRGLGNIGDKLSDACGFETRYVSQDLYLGDDGKLYLS